MKNYLLFAVLITTFQLFSQEAYFLAGSNITKYTYKSSGVGMVSQLQSGTGSSYEIGYSSPFNNEKLTYNISATLNDYNALAGSSANSYRWDTKYIGVQNALSYNFQVSNNFQLKLNGGLNLSTIIYGKENINGVVYDLINQDEFSGIIFSPFVGIHTRYKINDIGFLSFGYGYSKSLNPFYVSTEKLSFSTNQILFGIHFNVNNK